MADAAAAAACLREDVRRRRNPRAVVENLRILSTYDASGALADALNDALKAFHPQRADSEENKLTRAAYEHLYSAASHGAMTPRQIAAIMHTLANHDSRDTAVTSHRVSALQLWAWLGMHMPGTDATDVKRRLDEEVAAAVRVGAHRVGAEASAPARGSVMGLFSGVSAAQRQSAELAYLMPGLVSAHMCVTATLAAPEQLEAAEGVLALVGRATEPDVLRAAIRTVAAATQAATQLHTPHSARLRDQCARLLINAFGGDGSLRDVLERGEDEHAAVVLRMVANAALMSRVAIFALKPQQRAPANANGGTTSARPAEPAAAPGCCPLLHDDLCTVLTERLRSGRHRVQLAALETIARCNWRRGQPPVDRMLDCAARTVDSLFSSCLSPAAGAHRYVLLGGLTRVAADLAYQLTLVLSNSACRHAQSSSGAGVTKCGQLAALREVLSTLCAAALRTLSAALCGTITLHVPAVSSLYRVLAWSLPWDLVARQPSQCVSGQQLQSAHAACRTFLACHRLLQCIWSPAAHAAACDRFQERWRLCASPGIAFALCELQRAEHPIARINPFPQYAVATVLAVDRVGRPTEASSSNACVAAAVVALASSWRSAGVVQPRCAIGVGVPPNRTQASFKRAGASSAWRTFALLESDAFAAYAPRGAAANALEHWRECATAATAAIDAAAKKTPKLRAPLFGPCTCKLDLFRLPWSSAVSEADVLAPNATPSTQHMISSRTAAPSTESNGNSMGILLVPRIRGCQHVAGALAVRLRTEGGGGDGALSDDQVCVGKRERLLLAAGWLT